MSTRLRVAAAAAKSSSQARETRLLLRKSLRLLRDNQISRMQRKHGLSPI